MMGLWMLVRGVLPRVRLVNGLSMHGVIVVVLSSLISLTVLV